MKLAFLKGFLLKNHLLREYYLEFDWSSWIVLIKSEILITTEMILPVSNDIWKAPLVSHIGEWRFRDETKRLRWLDQRNT